VSKLGRQTRQDIIEAAGILLDVEGVRGATVELIAKTAGVTKRTLYYHFRSKDDLLAECLSLAAVKDRASILRLKSASANVEILIEALFSEIARASRDPKWKGCSFARAAFELAGLPGHPVVKAAKEHKLKIEGILTATLGAAGALEPEPYARRIVLLYEGAISQSVLHHDPAYAADAGQLALLLVRQSLDLGVGATKKAGISGGYAPRSDSEMRMICSLARRSLCTEREKLKGVA